MNRSLLVSVLFLAASPILAQTSGSPTPIAPGKGLRPPPQAKPASDRIASGLASPTFVTHAPGDSTRLFVTEQYTARIMIVEIPSNVLNPVPFLDINPLVIDTGDERGLLGLAFHPDYANNGLFYVNYSRTGDGDTVVAEYEVTGDPNVADPLSARTVLLINQPQSNHNGGWIGFSPSDGYLYVATGDGGGACDSGAGHTAGIGNAQDITTNLLGKMLRIDPLAAVPYGVPATNPFVDIAGDDEIWAYGLRNPWRPSFDRLTGDLWIADVGQSLKEEINFQPVTSVGGENYGWRCREGNSCATASPSFCPAVTGCTCPGDNPSLTAPVLDYGPGGCAITGGYIYRGSALPILNGQYFFVDFCSNAINSLRVEDGVVLEQINRMPDLSPSIDGFTISSVTSFGEDADGEMYVVERGNAAGATGELFKIVPAP